METGQTAYVVVRYCHEPRTAGLDEMDSIAGVFTSMDVAAAWIKDQDGLDGCEQWSYDIEMHAVDDPDRELP